MPSRKIAGGHHVCARYKLHISGSLFGWIHSNSDDYGIGGGGIGGGGGGGSPTPEDSILLTVVTPKKGTGDPNSVSYIDVLEDIAKCKPEYLATPGRTPKVIYIW